MGSEQSETPYQHILIMTASTRKYNTKNIMVHALHSANWCIAITPNHVNELIISELILQSQITSNVEILFFLILP